MQHQKRQLTGLLHRSAERNETVIFEEQKVFLIQGLEDTVNEFNGSVRFFPCRFFQTQLRTLQKEWLTVTVENGVDIFSLAVDREMKQTLRGRLSCALGVNSHVLNVAMIHLHKKIIPGRFMERGPGGSYNEWDFTDR